MVVMLDGGAASETFYVRSCFAESLDFHWRAAKRGGGGAQERNRQLILALLFRHQVLTPCDG